MSKLKRILAIHDISCVGKCSITEVLPVLSSAGIECSLLPTSLLSTHTGGFTNYTFLDLSNEMKKIVNHFKTLNLKIDGFYSGYLGSISQIDEVISYINELKTKNSIIYVDPVMADNGKLYPAFDINFAKKMLDLVKIADVLIPNITEACLLLDIPYFGNNEYSLDKIKDLCIKLSQFKANKIVISGVEINKNKIGLLSYDKEKNEFYYTETDKIDGYFHGTGDLLSSAIISCLTHNIDLKNSSEISIKFVFNSILKTLEQKTDLKYGVFFESCIYSFLNDIYNYLKK